MLKGSEINFRAFLKKADDGTRTHDIQLGKLVFFLYIARLSGLIFDFYTSFIPVFIL